MKTSGIIAEYNPFHLGHKYQIDKIKKELNTNKLNTKEVSTKEYIHVKNEFSRVCLLPSGRSGL